MQIILTAPSTLTSWKMNRWSGGWILTVRNKYFMFLISEFNSQGNGLLPRQYLIAMPNSINSSFLI